MYSHIQKMLLIFVICALVGLPGCSLTATRASVSVQINTGIFNAEGEIEWERQNETDSILGTYVLNMFGTQKTLSSSSSEVHMELEGENATVYNQDTTITLGIKHEGALLGAETFSATVSNGKLEPSNPQDVEQWLAGFDDLESGVLEISAPNISFEPPPAGSFEISSTLKDGSQTLASASSSGFIAPGGGCSDCVVQGIGFER